LVKNILKRILISIPVLIGVVLIIFIMLRVVPGDPVTTMLGEHVNQTVIDKISKEMGLDKPLYIQFFTYISHAIRGDFGTSYRMNRNVTGIILDAFPNTVRLAICAAVVSWIVGIAAGIFGAVNKNNILEGKKIKIASEVSLNKDEIKTTNKTVLNPEEESLLVQKMTTLKETEYQEITKKYEEQTQAVQKLIDSLNENKNKLDKLQKDLLSLNTMITIEETQSVSQPENEVQSDKNEQKTNLNNTIMENIKNQQPQNNTDNKIKIN